MGYPTIIASEKNENTKKKLLHKKSMLDMSNGNHMDLPGNYLKMLPPNTQSQTLYIRKALQKWYENFPKNCLVQPKICILQLGRVAEVDRYKLSFVFEGG